MRMGSLSAVYAVVVVLVVVAARAESLWVSDDDAQESTDVDERGYEVGDDDLVEDMFEYVIGEHDVVEGRKKKYKKKLIKYLAAAVLFKALLLPKILALVKLLTAKAYLLSLIALIAAAAAITSKKREPDTEQVINLLPKMGSAGRKAGGQERAYRYWRRRRFAEPEPEGP